MSTSEYLNKADCKRLIRLLNTPGYSVTIQKRFKHSVEDTTYALTIDLEVQGLWFSDEDTDVAFFGTDRIFSLDSRHVLVEEVNVMYKSPTDWYRRWIGKWREIELSDLPDLSELPECTRGDY